MTYAIEIKENQFMLLMSKPFAWQVLIPIDSGLVRGDVINYLEVDSLNVLTGRALAGIIDFVGSGDMILNEGSSTYAYCYRVSESIGMATIGGTLIVA